MDVHPLHHPLLPSSTAEVSGSTSNSGIALRIFLLISIGLISTWANHEASKGFVITVTNEIKNTPVGNKFSLFYVSNDEATRLVQSAANFATRILYPGPAGMPANLIDRVDIRLQNLNFTRDDHLVEAREENNYILSLNPKIMELSDFRYRIRREIQRGMTEILLYELQNRAPNSKKMMEAIVECISNLAGFGPENRVFGLRKCWEGEDLAEFLGYCEEKSEGFIGRLNRAMRERKYWDDHELLSRALGTQATGLCESFRSFVNGENSCS